MRAFVVSTSPRLLGSRELSSKSGPANGQTSGDSEKNYLMKGGVPKSIPLLEASLAKLQISVLAD